MPPFLRFFFALVLLMQLPLRAGNNALVSQQPSLTLPANAPEQSLPLRWTGWLLAPVKINGMDAGWFKIATGWTMSCIDPKVAERLKLVTVPQSGLMEASLNQSSQSEPEVVYRVERFQCGAAGAEDLWLHAYSMDEMSNIARALYGEGISGVIGWDLLKSLPFTLDYGKLELTWHSKVQAADGVQREALLPDSSLPFINAVVGDGVKAKALINTAFDTGASFRLGFAKEQGAKLRTGRRAVSSGIEFQKADDDDQLLSGEYANEPDSRFWTTLMAFGTESHPHATVSKLDEHKYGDVQIGFGMLRKFRITFDAPGSSLWTEPAKGMPEVQFLTQARGNSSESVIENLWLALFESDDAEAVRAYVKMGVPLEFSDPSKLTPLANACAAGAHAVAMALIDAGAKVEPFPGNGDVVTPLASAARIGDVELMRALLKAGANPDRYSSSGYTPLSAAAGSGSTEAVELMLTKVSMPKGHEELARIVNNGCAGGNVALAKRAWALLPSDPARAELANTILVHASLMGQVQSVEWLLNEAKASADQIGELPPLLAAIYRKTPEKSDDNRQKLVAMLLEKGADPNVSKHGVTPLLLAAKHGNAQIVQMLLKAGAKGKAKDFKSRNAIQRAAAANQPAELLAPLLEFGLDVNEVDSAIDRTALGSYAYYGNAQACKLLLDAGANPNIEMFTSPALVFATNGRTSSDADSLATLKLLLEHGATATSKTGRQANPFYGAVLSSRTSLIEPLVRSGVDLNEPMFAGVTAVALAAIVADLPTFEKIIELGGDPHAVDKFGASAVAHAAAAGRVKSLKLLLDKGASPNAEHPSDAPPLCVAANFRQLASVKVLINAKADLNAKNPRTGYSAYAIAKQNGDTVMMNVLREAGAELK